MAHVSDLPCDGDGACMSCKATPPPEDRLHCRTCITPWHVACLTRKPETLASVADWDCPDCSPTVTAAAASGGAAVVSGGSSSGELITAIRAIEADETLSEAEKARRRQGLLGGGGGAVEEGDDDCASFRCSICIEILDRPVTMPCGHNFCLKCFEKWIKQGGHSCAKCRASIPPKMKCQPRINLALVAAVRMARSKSTPSGADPSKGYNFVHNQNRPDKAYTTERAKKAGKSNAASGKIFVTIAPDHFGPILAENDPVRNQGVLVGESWEDRLECRQWGAHLPHVAGIAGQSEYGAQSVSLSGGYEDDEDHGEWFLYTGSGGRDLSGNKRTNKEQSFDQKFEKLNEALRISCKKGYPVRVVRSHKEKRSSYAPESGVRYDGIYRIERCWRKAGTQGFKVCRYLFVRCDNEPAPWTSETHGDRPRPLPVISELKGATDVSERKERPAWDFDESENVWKWIKPPPLSRKPALTGNADASRSYKKSSRRKIPRGQSFVRERTREGGRTLRTQKNIMNCPTCQFDITEFLKNPQINRDLMSCIEQLQLQLKTTGDDATDDKLEEEVDIVEGDMETPPNACKRRKTLEQKGKMSEEKGDDSPSSPLEVVLNSDD
ncbi:E3 ubiquitin-protein ligase ORTHRUS 2 [Acorus gramineus]|uniref:RING-type E3 ubiquitin transferase n=1 Tax=Acorus gramineus TaxID=55184 RepID=A0AAV9A636_ACOGR|nr:E3 ubiquitin-protein ligase ORTHRUS 2 [Acorus gramineus]